MERRIVSEDAEFGGDRFAFGLARHSDRKRRGSERIVDADSMGAQPQMKAVVERRRQHVVTQIGILIDADRHTGMLKPSRQQPRQRGILGAMADVN